MRMRMTEIQLKAGEVILRLLRKVKAHTRRNWWNSTTGEEKGL